MGFRLLTQIVLIVASLVILFTFVQPTFSKIKVTQDELYQYKEAVKNASAFNARLQELLSIKQSFPGTDLAALERLMPASIDTIDTMRTISEIFATRNVAITSMIPADPVSPISDISLETNATVQMPERMDVSYQDFEVTFTGTYWEMRDILLLSEASNPLLEIVSLNFTTAPAPEVDDEEDTTAQQPALSPDEAMFTIVFRTYGLPLSSI